MSAFDCKRSRTRGQRPPPHVNISFLSCLLVSSDGFATSINFPSGNFKEAPMEQKKKSASAIRSTWERHPIGTMCNASCGVYIVDVNTAGQRSSLSDSKLQKTDWLVPTSTSQFFSALVIFYIGPLKCSIIQSDFPA